MQKAQLSTQWGLPPGSKKRIGKGGINEIKYFPDGARLAVACTIGVWIYDVQTCKPLELITGHTGPVNSIVFSPDGGTFATASDDKTARLWDTITGEHKSSFVGHKDVINAVAFSPDGERLTTASDDKTIGLWDLHTEQQIAKLEGHKEKVFSAVFSPDGKVIASSQAFGKGGGIRIWNAQTGEFLKHFTEGTGHVEYIMYSPDGSMLISRESYRRVNFRDANTGEELKPDETEDWMYQFSSVAFAPDGRTYAVGIDPAYILDRTDICLWDIDTGKLLKKFELEEDVDSSPSSVAYSPDGEKIACVSEDGTIRLWNVNSSKISKTITDHTPHLSSRQKTEGIQARSQSNFSQRTFSVAYSPNGNTLASSYGTEIHFRNPETDEIQTAITGPQENVRALTYSPDSKILASAEDTTKARLWDVQNGRFLGSFVGHKENITSVAFSPDSSMLATGSQDNTICLWEVRGGELYLIGDMLLTLAGHTDKVTDVAFSPDGDTLASSSFDSTVRLWDVQSGNPKKTLVGHTASLHAVAYAPNGSVIGSGGRDGTVRIWNSQTGERIQTLNTHKQCVYSIAFSPNGKVISCGTNSIMFLWDMQTGELLRTYSGHTDVIDSIAYSPDGKTLASGSRDGTILLWDLDSTLKP